MTKMKGRVPLGFATAALARRSLIEDVGPAGLAEFEAAVRKASGVYIDAARAPDNVTNHTVLVVSFNYGYVQFFENWACHARRLGLKYLAWPDEPLAYDAASRNGACAGRDPGCTLYFSSALSASHPIDGVSANFRQPNFNLLTKFKFISVLTTLRRGRNVWFPSCVVGMLAFRDNVATPPRRFSDVDIAFIRDPWPAIKNCTDGADYVMQPNNPHHEQWRLRHHEANTGFHWFRSSTTVLTILDEAIEAMYTNSNIDDQTLFWDHLHTRGVVVGPASPLQQLRVLPSEEHNQLSYSLSSHRSDHLMRNSIRSAVPTRRSLRRTSPS